MSKVNRYFDIEVARELGTDEAIILYNIQFWIELNAKNKSQEHFKENKYWTYNSSDAFTEVFTWLSAKQIWIRIKKLVKAGYLEEGNFNKRFGDRTKWYALTSKSDQMGITISQNGNTEFPKWDDRFSQMGRPLPDINPDTKPDIQKSFKKNPEIGNKSFLLALDEETVSDFAVTFNCSENQVKQKAESLFHYIESKGKKYKNHKSLLRNALEKDFGRRKSYLDLILEENPDVRLAQ